MEQAVRNEDSPMARLALAEARTDTAQETGDLSVMRPGLADIIPCGWRILAHVAITTRKTRSIGSGTVVFIS
jgi:hypothetical protein